MRMSDWSSDVCSSDLLDMPEVWSGVVITRVQRGTPANRVGFRARDIIVSVNGQAFRRSGELAEALDRISERWQTVFKRDGTTRRVEFNSCGARGAMGSAERRVGKEGVRMCSYWWSQVHLQHN